MEEIWDGMIEVNRVGNVERRDVSNEEWGNDVANEGS